MECLGARVRLPGSPLDPTTYWLHDFGKGTPLNPNCARAVKMPLFKELFEGEESEIVYLGCLECGGGPVNVSCCQALRPLPGLCEPPHTQL